MSGALAFLLFKNLCETTRSTTTVSVPSIIKSWTQTCHTIFCPLIYSGTAARKSRAADCVNVTKSWTAMPFTRSAESHTMRRHANLGLYNSSQLCFHTNSTSHKKGNGNWTLLTKSFSCQTQFVRRLDRGVVMCSLSIPFSLLGVCIMLHLYPNELSSLIQKKLEACEGQSCSTSNGYSGKAPHGFGKKRLGKVPRVAVSWVGQLDLLAQQSHWWNTYDLASFHNDHIGDQNTYSMEWLLACGDWIRYIMAIKCQPGEVLMSLSETSWSIQNQKERNFIQCLTLLSLFPSTVARVKNWVMS